MLKKTDKEKLISALEKDSIKLDILIDDLIKMQKIIIICGPTGIGKSRLGIKIASLFDTDIISADSMQVYRGMDIDRKSVV